MLLSRSVCSAIFFLCLSGCAFIPTPVRLSNKPQPKHDEVAGAKVKICLIVRDERPEAIQRSNMCGMMRNLYMMPTSFVFLAHQEHLDQIVACHVKERLHNADGCYEVVQAYPKPPEELTAEQVKASQLDSKAKDQAWWKDSKTQQDPEAKKKGLTGGVEDLEEDRLPVWGDEIDVSGADYIVEVKIRKFWSDVGWGIDVSGVFAWMSANFAVCEAKDDERKVVFGKKVKGYGHGRGVTPLEAYNVPINMAYWFVLDQIDKVIASEDFQKVMQPTTVSSVHR